MKLPLSVFCTILLQLSLYSSLVSSTDIPDCDYFDTISLEDATKYDNGSYLYNGIIIPAEYTGEYDYEVYNYNETRMRENVEPHIRGCLCKFTSCMKLCCPQGQQVSHDPNARQCTKPDDGVLFEYSSWINITLNDGSVKEIDIFNNTDFTVMHSMPCEIMYSLPPAWDAVDGWQLFQNGTLLRHFDNAYLDREKYCLEPADPLDDNKYVLVPMNCAIYVNEETEINENEE